MTQLLDFLPFAAAACGIPQYLPQIRKVRRTGDTAGVSWPWTALTSVNNTAWFAYFTLSAYWTAMLPSSAAALLAGVLAVMLARAGLVTRHAVVLIGCWTALLVASVAVAGLPGLGTVLAAAFVIQVVPSIWTALRTRNPTGISRGTWGLVLGELACWLLYGLHRSDPRLIALGVTGVTAATLMLARTLKNVRPRNFPSGKASRRTRRRSARTPA
ncbi:PQ-loop repeat-containing protein [Fodinicola acaciae]|uniref:PQ-loop repeat-containing protein n=1 Tax=Fodinicola acaciae TaxID=2681555 RepID=UPI0013D67050|nr:PQ-loop repeat-containing protein [Fodinicola acaciae]